MRMPALLLLICSLPLGAADFGVRLTLGLGDTASTQWDGSATAHNATIASLEPWRFDGDDALNGTNAWKMSTHPIRLFGGAAAAPRPFVANGVILWLTGAGESTEISVQTAQGNFTIRVSDIPYGKPVFALEKRAMADRIPPVTRLTESADEQDYPAAAMAPNGDVWIVYLEFQHHPEHNRLRANFKEAPKAFSDWALPPGGDRIFVRRTGQGAPIAITKGGEDLYRPAIAIDGKGRPWVFWSANEKGNFDLWACSLEGSKPSTPLRITTAAGSDIDPVVATDSKGRVWVAWQAWRNGKAEIHSATQEDDGFTKEAVVSASKANEWNPAIAAGEGGRVTVAWESYRNGSYDLYYRSGQPNGSWGAEKVLANSARYEAYPSLAYAPDGRLWAAYEEGSERWGKDWGADESSGIALYQGRAIRLVGIEPDGRMVRPSVDPGTVLPGQPSQRVDSTARQEELTAWLTPKPDAWKNRDRSRATQAQPAPKNSYPRLAVDGSGRLWLAARSAHPIWWNPLGTVWSEYVVSYNGDRWTGPVWLSHSDNLLDNRPALVSVKPGELTIVGASDNRRHFYLSQLTRRPGSPGIPMIVKDPYQNDLYLTQIALPPGPESAPMAAVEAFAPLPAAGVDSDNIIESKAVAAMRTARVYKKYRVARGEFHRHSDISMDGGNDGSILEQWRYILDAADMDWSGCCDHDNGGGREYSWWISQKLTDIFYTPGRFVPMFSYERSVPYPEGHRNTVFEQRGIRPLPRLPISSPDRKQRAPDTRMFYDYLRTFKGIVASHTSGTNMGTDWRDNDPAAEPVVEIYQGERQNYERPDAPRANNEQDSIGGWRPLGFINLALEMGYKLAFQASSDHISTHMSYCNVLTTDLTRKAVLEGFQKRHVYGATDNILAEFSSGAHIMGDAFTTSATPEFAVRLVGTAPFRKVHVIKDNKYVYTTEPNTAMVQFRWRDAAPESGKTSYYYVRGEQQDGEVVWVSPIWVTYQK
ncbi:MAG: hypothetical protein WD696_08790 [Bryobacteraceae bacterium]